MSSQREKLGKFLVEQQPWLLKNGDKVWRLLRRLKPVLRIKGMVILTRHADVREVLERDDVFSVTYGAHMEAVTGPFILGWDDGPDYRREVAALRAAVRRDDLPHVADLTRDRARALVATGDVDAVRLADEAVGVGLDRYFGLPELAGPDLREAARDVFRAVFLDAETPETVARGQAASQRLVAAIDAAIARERGAGAAHADTVLRRLLDAGDRDDDFLHRNLVGLVAAWAASVPRAFSLALDALLDRPAELAALSGTTDEDAIARMWLEALRLQPQAPFLTRVARSELVIAPGAPREARIRPGDIVFAVTQSAMHDRTVLDGPERLVPGRPADDHLHFGAGIHRCFGAGISQAQFGALGAVLLEHAPIERAGPLEWGAAFPGALPLRLGT